MRIAKYRPCFTSEQISHILALCKRDLSDASLSVISVLAPFNTKIENKCIAPAYSMQEEKSLYASLGINDEYFGLTPPEKQKRAFEKWSLNPDSCNVEELELVQSYRMLNDLMSSEEVERVNVEMAIKIASMCGD